MITRDYSAKELETGRCEAGCPMDFHYSNCSAYLSFFTTPSQEDELNEILLRSGEGDNDQHIW